MLSCQNMVWHRLRHTFLLYKKKGPNSTDWGQNDIVLPIFIDVSSRDGTDRFGVDVDQLWILERPCIQTPEKIYIVQLFRGHQKVHDVIAVEVPEIRLSNFLRKPYRCSKMTFQKFFIFQKLKICFWWEGNEKMVVSDPVGDQQRDFELAFHWNELAFGPKRGDYESKTENTQRFQQRCDLLLDFLEL